MLGHLRGPAEPDALRIERHAHDPDSKEVPEKDFRVSDWPDELRKKRLRPFTAALFAASTKADKKRPETTTELVTRLAGLVGADPTRATTWKEWQAGVESSAPPLLVILPHTLPHPKLRVPTLEIGNEQLVRFDKIDAKYVGANSSSVSSSFGRNSKTPNALSKR